jgi:hypothetical protein
MIRVMTSVFTYQAINQMAGTQLQSQCRSCIEPVSTYASFYHNREHCSPKRGGGEAITAA